MEEKISRKHSKVADAPKKSTRGPVRNLERDEKIRQLCGMTCRSAASRMASLVVAKLGHGRQSLVLAQRSPLKSRDRVQILKTISILTPISTTKSHVMHTTRKQGIEVKKIQSVLCQEGGQVYNFRNEMNVPSRRSDC